MTHTQEINGYVAPDIDHFRDVKKMVLRFVTGISARIYGLPEPERVY